jgi:DNA transformation protein
MGSPAWVEHCCELLAPLGAVRARRMFGGHGLYVDDLFVAILADDRLFLKTDADSRPRFDAAGCQPFSYEARGKTFTLAYWTVPPDAMESAAAMAPWGRLALQAAVAARGAQASRARVSRPRGARGAPAKKSTTGRPR